MSFYVAARALIIDNRYHTRPRRVRGCLYILRDHERGQSAFLTVGQVQESKRCAMRSERERERETRGCDVKTVEKIRLSKVRLSSRRFDILVAIDGDGEPFRALWAFVFTDNSNNSIRQRSECRRSKKQGACKDANDH